ncbi:MAG: CDP-glucose 4,6-dehydratase [Chitinophagaceae bacterium]|nr:CDP-glucose 4,6-dehydratase [Chitinophagaceae bacterium]
MKELKNTYFGKRVFVTGHTGFKGTWLIKILSDLGAIIRGYALAPENETNLYTQINGDSLCESVISDLRDRNALKNAVLDFQPDFIFHLAAQPLVRLSYEMPSETFEVNAIGTANLLDAIRLLNKKCNIVLITTDKVYHNNEWEQPYKESDKLGGYDPYSASKACCELIIDSYKNSFFNAVKYDYHNKAIAVGRAGNVIGGGDWSKDRLIPDIVKALHAKKQVVVRNPKAVRPWQHVVEPLFGYLELGDKLDSDPIKFAQAYNFGPNINDALSVEEMVVMSINCWGAGTYNIEVNSNNPHEAGLLRLDITKAINSLKWRPILNAQSAVERTINWYKNFYNNAIATELMELDIKYYQSKINE